MRPILALAMILSACTAQVDSEPTAVPCPTAEAEDLGDDPCGVAGSDAINFMGECACLLDCPVHAGCARRECTLEGIDTDAYWGTCSWSECAVP